MVAGIGFTVSLFVTGLAFTDAALVDDAKIGILAGSAIIGVLGLLAIRFVRQRAAIESGLSHVDRPAVRWKLACRWRRLCQTGTTHGGGGMGTAIAIPTTLDELTAPWLTDALRSSGVIGDGTSVSALSLETLGQGAGFIGQLARADADVRRACSPARRRR